MHNRSEKSVKKTWQRIRYSYGPDLKLFRTRFDWMRNPRNGHEEKMIVLEGSDAVQVVAESDDGKILLVRQYRFGIGEYIYELPGGLIDAGETPAVAAVRELREETAYTSDNWKYLGKQAANPVFMSAYVHHFAARKLTRVGDQILDLGEEVAVEWLDRKEVKDRLLAGQFQHPHTVCALVAYFAAEW
jgi:8-oxo-dGTP pyrophosphatase MutT (NUDIX family)